MPMEAQTRLLRVLQEGEYHTVGGTRPIRTDVRIIAATHRDLRQLIAQGQFREDLFFRLNVVPIRLPPLRERPGDIPDLVQYFLTVAAREGLPQKTLSQGAIERMMEHRWPGNIRELENLIRRVVAVHPGEEISAQVIEEELNSAFPATRPADEVEAPETLSEFAEGYLNRYFAQHAPALPPPGLYQRMLRELELPLISAALAATQGNQIRAAELLGINRNTLRTRIRDLGIRVVRGAG
jgi:two-component system nitrogen regulation response regulator GlnG